MQETMQLRWLTDPETTIIEDSKDEDDHDHSGEYKRIN